MLKLARVLLWSIAFAVVVGLAARAHPVLGTLLHLLRWPAAALAFLAGGLAFARGAMKPAVAALVLVAALFGDWLHGRLTSAAVDDLPAAGAPLRVLTYNLGALAPEPELVLEALHAHPADVVLLQEFTPTWRTRLDREPVLRGMNREYRGRGDGGLAVYVRGPLRRVSLVSEPQGADIALCAELDHGGTAWLACSVRLAAPFWRPDALQLAEHWVVNARRREAQWHQLAEHIRDTARDIHVVVAGDFATAEWEPLHRTVRRDLVDAYRAAAWGWGATWPCLLKEPPVPLLRWDYVWITPSVAPLEAEVVPLTGSMHRAVRATLQPLRLTTSAGPS